MTCCAYSSSLFRSLPKSLIELAPLTPERASSTLSRMSCEKLKLIPGNSLNFAASSSWIFSRVMPGRHSSMGRKRHVELDVEEAGHVGAVVGPADVRHHPLDLRHRGDHLAEPGGDSRGRLERHGPRQDGPDPEVALLELGHELAAQRRDQGRREGQQPAQDQERGDPVPEHPDQGPDVSPLHHPVDERVLLLVLALEEDTSTAPAPA